MLGTGVTLAVSGGAVVEYLTRRGRMAERQARENRRQYERQRVIAGELQRALLPSLPEFDGVEVATRYYTGVTGTDVGGDWFDVVQTDENRFVMVVGDVSGRGLKAASTMASLRFPLRANLLNGDPVEQALAKLSPLLDVDSDQQFATVLAAELDLPAGRMTVVSAGHLLPLVVTDGGAEFVSGRVDTPIGVAPSVRPTPITVDLPDSATVLFFSDGLVERVGELLDVGLERLRQAASRPAANVGQLVDAVSSDLVPGEAHDDTIILGVRWLN